MVISEDPVQQSEQHPEAWVFVLPDAVPDRWRDRVQPVSLVRLRAGEIAEWLSPVPRAESEDERFERLVAEGRSRDDIARELGITERSVSRRLAKLRSTYGIETNRELVALLSRRVT